MSVGSQRLRDEPDVIRRGAIAKGEDPGLVDRALALDAERRRLLGEAETLKAERNVASRRFGEAIKAGAAPDGPDVAALRAASTTAGERIKALDETLAETEAALEDLLLRIPNPPDPDIPVGGEEANVTVRTWGELLPRDQPLAGEAGADAPAGGATWTRRPHWEIGEALDILDNARGAKITGSGFPVYKGAGSALQRGLINWFLDVHTRENGMTEVWPPAMVNADSARGTGQIPDKEDQMYVVTRDELYLVPTAEVPVTNLHRDEILDAGQLPIRYAAYSPCFRREAGAAGKDTRGILRKPGEYDMGQWAAIDNRYFMVAFIPPAGLTPRVIVSGSKGDTVLALRHATQVPAGGSLTLRYQLYAGPKGYTQLKHYGKGLEENIDFGTFSGLGRLILNAIYQLQKWTGFQACRFGLDGTMVDPHTRERRTIREDILATLRKVEAHGAVLQSLPALEEIERCAARDGNHATHLRKVYSGSRNVQSMVQESARALRGGTG